MNFVVPIKILTVQHLYKDNEFWTLGWHIATACSIYVHVCMCIIESKYQMS